MLHFELIEEIFNEEMLSKSKPVKSGKERPVRVLKGLEERLTILYGGPSVRSRV